MYNVRPHIQPCSPRSSATETSTQSHSSSTTLVGRRNFQTSRERWSRTRFIATGRTSVEIGLLCDAKKTSFETITWKMKPGIAPDKQPRPTAETVLAMSSAQTRMSGTNPGYVGGETKFIPSYVPYGGGSTYESSYWELRCDLQDGPGDGTVPKSAGAAPQAHGGANVKAQFQISGIDHEGAFNVGASRTTTLYAITKVLSEAKVPA